MKTQKFELNKMGLSAMSEFEMLEVDGGGFWKWLEAIGVVALAVGMVIGSAGLATAGAAAVIIGAIGDGA